MKTILVTGSEGNIGVFIVKALRRAHPDAKIIRVKFAESFAREGEELYAGDLLDASFVSRLIEESRPTHIIHAAARPYNVFDLRKHPFQIFSDDLRITLNLLEATRDAAIAWTYLSSATVYDAGTEEHFSEEMTDRLPLGPSPIGAAKTLSERAVWWHAKEYGNPFTIWRFWNIVSPREPHDREGGHVIVDFYRKLFVDRAPSLDVYGDGRQVRCFTWVEDAANAIASFLDDPRAKNEIFNLGSDEPKTLLELKDALLVAGKELGVLPAEYAPKIVFKTEQHPGEISARIPSIEKARRVLGWIPQTNFPSCVKKFVEAKQQL